jgi:hypothetical protein
MTEESLPTLGDSDTRARFIADGVVNSHIPGIIDRALAAAAGLFASGHDDKRGPVDYEQDLKELRDLARRGLRDHEPNIQISNHEGDGDKVPRWLMPGLVTLSIAGIIGQVIGYANQAAMKQEIEDLKAQVNRVEKLVEPRYRGG